MKQSFNSNASRRMFLKQMTALGTFGSAAPLALNLAAMGQASAQTATDYKALVCLYMTGGNDAFNTVLATDPDSWAAYNAVRGQGGSSIALAADKVLRINPANAQGRSFALHPSLSNLQRLFNNDKRVAIVSNVGALIEPVTKAQYESKTKRLPAKLFSHNDQQTTWLAMRPEGASSGWGGRLADYVAAGNGDSLFTAISAAGNSVWLSGKNVKQYQISPKGAVKYGNTAYQGDAPMVFNSTAVGSALHALVQQQQTSSVFASDLASVASRSIAAEKLLTRNLPLASDPTFGGDAELMYTVPVSGAAAVNPLAQQLQIVARTIAARTALGVKRQVFFVNLFGFDTHDSQVSVHADRLARVDHAISYFNNVLNRLGASDQVTTFTASDFGRSFTSNGDGTDHGWGAHHFVMGGAVRGGDIYGAFPVLSRKNASNNGFDGSPDQAQNGVLIPRVSVDEYGATLARWMGLTSSQMLDVFPNYANFSDRQLMSFV